MDREGDFFVLRTQMFVPQKLATVFPFFADARNLERITPPWLHFEILSPLPVHMRAGATIDYRLRLHGWPLRWQSEITAWNPPHQFVDEQRRGPYRKWIHEHTFRECGRDCEVEDYVKYAVAGGRLVHFLFVKNEVRRIFQYREKALKKIFRVNPLHNKD